MNSSFVTRFNSFGKSNRPNISKMAVFGGPQLHFRGRQRYACTEFFVVNLILQNFYSKHFSIKSVFFTAFSPELNLLFRSKYSIIFKKLQIFGALQLHSWGRYRYAFTEFLVGNLILQNFYLKHFSILSIFFAAFSLKANVLLCSKDIIIFKKLQIFGALLFHSWGRQRYVLTEFFVGNLILNNIRLNHFLISSVFFAVFSPRVNLLTC